MVRRVSWLACAFVVASGLRPAESQACSFSRCESLFFPARGAVPANLPHVMFWPARPAESDGGAPTPGVEVRFVRLEGAGAVDVPFTIELDDEASRVLGLGKGYRILPGAPLQVGARYALWAKPCSEPINDVPPTAPDEDPMGSKMPRGRFAVFDVTAASPAPTSLGAVQVSQLTVETLQLKDLRGGCAATRTVDAVGVVSGALSSPWVDAIAFSTYVDGKPYFASNHLAYDPAYGSSWIGHGRDKLVSLCNRPEYAAPFLLQGGRHTVQFRGHVPGSSIVLNSDEVEVEFADCASDAGSGPPPSGAGGATGTGGMPASGGASAGAGGGSVSDAGAEIYPHETESACSCSLRRRSPAAPLSALIAALFVARRRRAHPCPAADCDKSH